MKLVYYGILCNSENKTIYLNPKRNIKCQVGFFSFITEMCSYIFSDSLWLLDIWINTKCKVQKVVFQQRYSALLGIRVISDVLAVSVI